MEDFDFLISLEEYLIQSLAADCAALVDGHDFGMGEFNVFIHTDEPREFFTRVGDLIGDQRPDLPVSAGFRASDDEEYTSLWPPSSAAFSVA
jgi:hypothetical protein